MVYLLAVCKGLGLAEIPPVTHGFASKQYGKPLDWGLKLLEVRGFGKDYVQDPLSSSKHHQ